MDGIRHYDCRHHRKLKQSGVERLTDIVIEKKEQENNKSQNKNE